MPYRKFFEGGSEYESLDELAILLTNPNIRILWKHAETLMFKQKDKGIYGKTIFYIFYQDIREELKQEQSDFKGKLEIAKQVSIDERYVGCEERNIKSLKNQRQRELFLLSEYFLSKTEAQDVMELLKPEMAKIIRESEEEDVEEDVKGVILVENPKKINEEEIDKEMKEIEKELDE